MTVYRLGKSVHADDISGTGAKLYGGRWNSAGVPMLYTSQSRALCMAEVLVHIPLNILPKDYCITSIAFPDSLKIKEVSVAMLPMGWDLFPYHRATQEIGDAFIQEAKFLALKVPSVVVQGDFNYLLNPLHKDFAYVRVLATLPFEFDSRLFNFDNKKG